MMACVSSAPVALFPAAATADSGYQHLALGVRKNALRVVRELGSGLQGRVVLAFDEDAQRHVAVKLPSAFDRGERLDADVLEYQMRAIMHERNAMRRVSHQHVVQYLRAIPGKKGRHEYTALVTEYAPNGDLFDILADSGALSERLAKMYFRQLLLALEACHSRGVVHRDVKLENILLDAQFNLKLCDFGLAVASRWDDSADEIMLKGESGTAMYMAPEVHSKRPYRGTPVDAWSAGVVLFILLTGVPPFDNAVKGDFWYDCLLEGDLRRFWSSQQAEATRLSAGAQDLVSRLLCADPERRLTVKEALQHPWIADAEAVHPMEVIEEMSARRQRSLAN